jgi:hypothetical protein
LISRKNFWLIFITLPKDIDLQQSGRTHAPDPPPIPWSPSWVPLKWTLLLFLFRSSHPVTAAASACCCPCIGCSISMTCTPAGHTQGWIYRRLSDGMGNNTRVGEIWLGLCCVEEHIFVRDLLYYCSSLGRVVCLTKTSADTAIPLMVQTQETTSCVVKHLPSFTLNFQRCPQGSRRHSLEQFVPAD